VDTANGELEPRRPHNITDQQLRRSAREQVKEGEKEADLKAGFRTAGLEAFGPG